MARSLGASLCFLVIFPHICQFQKCLCHPTEIDVDLLRLKSTMKQGGIEIMLDLFDIMEKKDSILHYQIIETLGKLNTILELFNLRFPVKSIKKTEKCVDKQQFHTLKKNKDPVLEYYDKGIARLRGAVAMRSAIESAEENLKQYLGPGNRKARWTRFAADFSRIDANVLEEKFGDETEFLAEWKCLAKLGIDAPSFGKKVDELHTHLTELITAFTLGPELHEDLRTPRVLAQVFNVIACIGDVPGIRLTGC